jgi:thiol-disulfide isomerase/thioredoxin
MRINFFLASISFLITVSCSREHSHSRMNNFTLTTDDSEKLYQWSTRMYGRLCDPKLNGADSSKWKVYALMSNNLMPQNHFPPFIKRYYLSLKNKPSSYFHRQDQLTALYGDNWPRHYMDTTYKALADSEIDEKLLSGKYDAFPWLDTIFVYLKPPTTYLNYLFDHPRAAPTLKERSLYDYPSFTDLKGNLYNESNLKNKVIVINYWFINCVPCRQEMPELNKIVDYYKNNSSVVFLGISLDSKDELINALKSFDFNYNIIPNSNSFLDSLHLDGYPSHEVIDKAGKVIFSCTEAGKRTIGWLRRSIEIGLASK